MKPLFKLASLLLLIVSYAHGVAVVTGKITTPNTLAPTVPSFVQFELLNCGNFPAHATQPFEQATLLPVQRFYADSSGNISGSLVRNDQISCGGVTSSNFYQATLYANNSPVPGSAQWYRITGSTFDFNVATPITAHPVIIPPTGDGSYIRIDAGNNPVTGVINFGAGFILPSNGGANDQFKFSGQTELTLPTEASLGCAVTALSTYACTSTAAGTFKMLQGFLKTASPRGGMMWFQHTLGPSQTVPENAWQFISYQHPTVAVYNNSTSTDGGGDGMHRSSFLWGTNFQTRWWFVADYDAVERPISSCGNGAGPGSYVPGVSACGANAIALRQKVDGESDTGRLILFPIVLAQGDVIGGGTGIQTQLFGNLDNTGTIRSRAGGNNTTARAAIALRANGGTETYMRLNAENRIVEFASARDGGTVFMTIDLTNNRIFTNNNLLALWNGTNAQTFNFYKTDDGAGNAEWFSQRWDAVSTSYLFSSEATGSGVTRTTCFGSSGTCYWGIGSSAAGPNLGNLFANADNTYDIGRSGALRPRTVYAGTSVITPAITVSGAAALGTISEASGKFTVDANGVITKANNIATVANGVAQIVAEVNTTALTANVGSTNMLTAPATGTYRMSCYVVVTTAGTTSTMPACQGEWTDPDTSVLLAAVNVTQTSTANTIGTSSSNAGSASVTGGGSITFQAKTGTSIFYDTTGYASTGTAMQYAIHLKLEYLGN